MSAILGVLAMLVSLSVVFFGLTTQAWKNYRRKSCEGLSLTLMLVTLLAYTTWGAYGLSKPDWFLVSSQIPGVILSLVIVEQGLFYDYLPARRKRQEKKWEEELANISATLADNKKPRTDMDRLHNYCGLLTETRIRLEERKKWLCDKLERQERSPQCQ